MLAKNLFQGNAIDLTEDGIYTVSDGTRDILQQNEEPLEIRFFFSEEQANGLPVFQAYATRIRGLLSQYAGISDGSINVTYYNPQPFTEEEDLAVSHGLQGIPIDATGTKFYFGLSIENTADARGVVPFFDPARDTFLEYDMTRLIHEVANPQQKKISMISTLPLRGGGSSMQSVPTGPWAIYNQIQEQFDVEVLQPSVTSIPKDTDVLMLVHPHSLSDDTLYTVEQYIMAGGKVLMFLDSFSALQDVTIKSSRMDKLMSQWGVSLSADKIAGEKDAAISIQSSDSESRLSAFPNITWLEMGQDYLSQESVVTASLNTIRMIDSGYFTKKEDADIRFEPLITTTPAATTVDVAKIRQQRDTLSLYRNYVPEGEPLVLATIIKGIIHTAWPEKKEETHIATSPESINVIAVGDTDMLRDAYWVRSQNFFGTSLVTPTADNGAFVMNALEYLSGNDALIDLRTRGTKDRRFSVMDDMKREAELAFREEEERLKSKLAQMEARMRELQEQQQEGSQLFTDTQTDEIQNFRNAFLETRKELRAVQRRLKQDIESLGTRIALANIVVIPIILLLLAFIVPSWLRRTRRKGTAS